MSDRRLFASGIAALTVTVFALSAFANGALLGAADAHPWSTPAAAINFVITGPGGPQVNVHNVACPAIQVQASTGSAASCEFTIARSEVDEPSSVDIAVTATLEAPSSIELDRFTFEVVGGGSWAFTSFPQVIATESAWPWSTKPWSFVSHVSWSDLSNASLGGSVTLVLVIDLTSDQPTASPTPTPTPTPTLPDTGGTPTPTPTLPDTGGTPTPTPTLPDTSDSHGIPGWPHDPTSAAFLLIFAASVASIVYLYLTPSRRGKRTR